MTYEVTFLTVFCETAYGVAVFDDIFSCSKVVEQHLMACRHVFCQCYFNAFYIDGLSLLERGYSHSHIVGWIDSDDFHWMIGC